MKLKVLLILMLAAVTFTSYAQDGGIRGKVVSRNGRVVLSNVQVKIESLGLTAMTDKDGNFIWPGFGDNMRVLNWIVDRCEGKADATETAIGYVPKPEDIDLTDLDMDIDTLKSILDVDKDTWTKEAAEIEEHYKKFGDKLPQELRNQLATLKANLEK